MAKLSKRVKAIKAKVDRNKSYGFDNAVSLVKEFATAKGCDLKNVFFIDDYLPHAQAVKAVGASSYLALEPLCPLKSIRRFPLRQCCNLTGRVCRG